jgi:hypothetical protein
MSNFRKYGGMNYSANNNITKSHISNANNISISNRIGQINSKEIFDSHIDMSGNSVLHLGCLYFQDGSTICGIESIINAILSRNNNWTGTNTFNNTISSNVVQPDTTDNSTLIPTTAWVQSVIDTIPLPEELLITDNIWTGTNTFNNTISSNVVQPSATDNSTLIPTTAWVQSAIATIPLPEELLITDNIWTGTNTFNNTITSNVSQPSATDNSTLIPTTAWVQSAIANIPLPENLLINNNNWTGTNTFNNTISSNVSQPSATDNSTLIPTTAWVQSAIANIPLPENLLINNNNWTGTNTFNNTISSNVVQPSATDNSTLIPTTAWVQSAIATIPLPEELLIKNNIWTGTNTFNNTIYSNVVQPSATDNSTLIPTTSWVQSAVSRLLTTDNNWTGSNTFNSSLPTSIQTPTLEEQLVTKQYADTKTTLSEVQEHDNIWTGTNTFSNSTTFTGSTTFNSSLPTSTQTPTLEEQLVTKQYADTKTTLSEVQEHDNIWTGTNTFSNSTTFNSSLPTSTQTPTLEEQLVTKQYADTKTTLSEVQEHNNIWVGTNTFNISLPTSTLTPTTASQLVTKQYADTKTTLSEVQSNNNTWTNTNTFSNSTTFTGPTTFNSSLPTSTLTPSTPSQLVTKQYADTKTTLSAVQSNNNTWTGTNTFNNTITSNVIQPSSTDNSTSIPTTAWVQSAITSSSTRLLSKNNTWTGTNTFNNTISSNVVQPSATDNSTLIPTTAWVQSAIANIPLPGNLLIKDNIWTGTNTFNNTISSNVVQPPATDNSTSIPTTSWVQSAITSSSAGLLSKNNTWTGTNTFSNSTIFTGSTTFNSSLPTSTLTPTTTTQLVTKQYADTKTTLSSVQSNNNTWTGTNTFNNNISQGGSYSFTQSDTSTYTIANTFRSSNIYGNLTINKASSGGGLINIFDSGNQNTGFATSIYQTGATSSFRNLGNGGRTNLYLSDISGNEIQALAISQTANKAAIGIGRNDPSRTLDVLGNSRILSTNAIPGETVLEVSASGISNRSINFIPYSGGGGANNPLNNSQGDNIIMGIGSNRDVVTMKILTWSSYRNGMVIEPISTTIYGNNSNIAIDGSLNQITFDSTNPPISTAQQPLPNDISTKIPTTTWVQSAITSTSSGLLPNNNTWTGTNNFTRNVGIGTTTTSANLDVKGSIIATGTITTGSDYRIKNNITELKLSDYSVDHLRPVIFNFKDNNKTNIGLIAHELQEYYPFLVEGEKDGNSTQTVNYIGLIGVLIKEIQILKERINVLEINNKIEMPV